VTFVDFRVLD